MKNVNKRKHKLHEFFIDKNVLQSIDNYDDLNVYVSTTKPLVFIFALLAIFFFASCALGTGLPLYYDLWLATAVLFVFGTLYTYISFKTFLKTDNKCHVFRKHIYAHLFLWPYVLLLILFCILSLSPHFIEYPLEEIRSWLFPLIYLLIYLLLLFILYLFGLFGYQKECEKRSKEIKPNNIEISNTEISEETLPQEIETGEVVISESKWNVLNFEHLYAIKDKKIIRSLINTSSVPFIFAMCVVICSVFTLLYTGEEKYISFIISAITILIFLIPSCYGIEKFLAYSTYYKIFKKSHYPMLFTSIFIIIAIIFFLLIVSTQYLDYPLGETGDWLFPLMYVVLGMISLISLNVFANKAYVKPLIEYYKKLDKEEIRS